MALPADFWRNDQTFNIFKSKPCQRLCREGLCEWRSQCQYSHCPECPRRPPLKTQYGPDICPYLKVYQNANGEVQIENNCPNTARCQHAHSKEEVLYHPSIHKTTMCEEIRANSNQRSSRNNNRPRCHRYYCPFAHSPQELRQSPYSEEQLAHFIRRAMEFFPSDECCRVCSPHRISLRHEGSQSTPIGFVPSVNQQNHQDVAQSPQPAMPAAQMWAMPMQAGLQDGQSENMMQKDFMSPYQHNMGQQPPHLMSRQPWPASPEMASFNAVAGGPDTGQGCNQVNSPPCASTPPPPMLVVGPTSPGMQGMTSPVNTTQGVPMVQMQMTPQGMQGMGALQGPPGSMQMVQMTPVPAHQAQAGGGSDGSHENLRSVLQSIGMDRFYENFKHNGIEDKEAVLALGSEQLAKMGINQECQQNLRQALEKAMHPQGNAPRTPNVGQQLVMVPSGYGQWMPATTPPPPEQGGMQPYGMQPNLAEPWANCQQSPTMVAGFIPNVQADQRGQVRQPGFQPPGQPGQQVQFFPSMASMPAVPPFPVNPAQSQGAVQNQQSAHPFQVYLQQSAQTAAVNQVPSHLQNQHPGMQQPAGQQQQQQPPQMQVTHYTKMQQMQPQMQQQQQLGSPQQQPNNMSSSGTRRTPPPSDDGHHSLERTPETNGHANGNQRSPPSSKKRMNMKLERPQDGTSSAPIHMRNVEKLLEGADPGGRTITEIHSRLFPLFKNGQKDGHSELAVSIAKLNEALQADGRFVVSGQQVTLVRYTHRDEVKHLNGNMQSAQAD